MIRPVGKREIVLLFAVAVLTIVAGAAALYMDSTPEWRYYQTEFREIVAENVASVDPSQIPSGIQQIWIEPLDRVDRCTTCHLGMLWEGLEDVEQPWTSHPNRELFEAHPLEEFGCTSCHAGQGFGLTTNDAHGFAEHWEQPLLSGIIGSEYDPRDPPPLYEIQCNFCHRYERATEGMEYVNNGPRHWSARKAARSVTASTETVAVSDRI